ncbi:MAG: BBE domain-containing protein, partial [Verrucomicrobiaceae bacterium]|nr:BBE domain-containing protein [Verrucomicrobiaceae bacterium]
EYARPNPSASFIHRAPRTLIRHTVTLGAHSTQELRDHGRDWVDASQLSLRQHANGHSYQGYADLRLDNWAHAYYGESYSRLRCIKSHYDPQNIFHHAQSIRPME